MTKSRAELLEQRYNFNMGKLMGMFIIYTYAYNSDTYKVDNTLINLPFYISGSDMGKCFVPGEVRGQLKWVDGGKVKSEIDIQVCYDTYNIY